MSSLAKYELWPVNDLANIITALDLSGAGNGSDYDLGWHAALAALRVAIGVSTPTPTPAPREGRHSHAAPMILDIAPRRDEPEPPRRGPIEISVFEGIEDIPWAIRAFANLK